MRNPNNTKSVVNIIGSTVSFQINRNLGGIFFTLQVRKLKSNLAVVFQAQT